MRNRHYEYRILLLREQDFANKSITFAIVISKSQIKLIRSLELRKYRKAEQLFVAEGPKVVNDLRAAGFEPRLIVEGADVEKVSFLQHPQGILAVFEIPQPHNEPLSGDELYLALDGVQDPGNLGTIIRLADWFGIRRIFCSANTADAYNPKVVQATMGSLARVSITYTNLPELLRNRPEGMPVYGTLLDGTSLYEQPLSPRGFIVMGNEGNGLSGEVRSLVTHRLLIPNYPAGVATAESLNVAIATAIVCAEFRRRNG